MSFNGFKSEPLASLAYAYEENNPVNNALVDNVIGTLTGKKIKAPKVSIWCNVCNIEFNSQVTYDTHINGAKHAKKVKAKQILKSLQEEGQVNEDEDLTTLKCTLCNIVVNSSQQLQMHLAGSKHKNKCRKSEVMEVGDNDGSQPTPAKQARLYCEVCSLSLNSTQQYQQHISSQKHVDKSEGRTPAKKKKQKKKGGATKSNNAGFGIPPLSQSFLQTSTMA